MRRWSRKHSINFLTLFPRGRKHATNTETPNSAIKGCASATPSLRSEQIVNRYLLRGSHRAIANVSRHGAEEVCRFGTVSRRWNLWVSAPRFMPSPELLQGLEQLHRVGEPVDVH